MRREEGVTVQGPVNEQQPTECHTGGMPAFLFLTLWVPSPIPHPPPPPPTVGGRPTVVRAFFFNIEYRQRAMQMWKVVERSMLWYAGMWYVLFCTIRPQSSQWW